MKYIVYLTTNLKSSINGKSKIYIGVHGTKNPDIFDGYIGCGVYVQLPSTYKYPKTPFLYAVKKYGVDSFKRIVLFTFDSKEEAYEKEKQLVNAEFIKQPHVYNVCLGGICNNAGIPLYQFDLEGNLKKRWDYSSEAFEFYGYLPKKFHTAIYGKLKFLDSYWSYSETINIEEYYTTKWGNPKSVYLYSKDGKLLNEFDSEKECAKYLNIYESTVNKAITQSTLLLKSYYVSLSLIDEFKPKSRIQWMKKTFFVYDVNNKFYGSFVGKEVMSIISLHSWNAIKDIFRYNHGWYKDFYLSLTEINNVPEKKHGHGNSICVDVYDKYGNFIETLNSIKEVKEKYKTRTSDVKNIMKGDKYFKNWIFKYHTNRIVNDIV